MGGQQDHADRIVGLGIGAAVGLATESVLIGLAVALILAAVMGKLSARL